MRFVHVDHTSGEDDKPRQRFNNLKNHLFEKENIKIPCPCKGEGDEKCQGKPIMKDKFAASHVIFKDKGQFKRDEDLDCDVFLVLTCASCNSKSVSGFLPIGSFYMKVNKTVSNYTKRSETN